GGKPEQMGLKAILKYYINYQREVVVRRANYDLRAARARADIVAGLLIAIRNIDEVIKIIKESESTSKAKISLRERFDLNDDQAQAILDMRLKALARLEVGRLEEELAVLEKTIKRLTAILASKKLQYDLIKEEILAIKKDMNSERMSIIVDEADAQNIDIPSASEAVAYRDGTLISNSAGTLRFMSKKAYSLAVKDMSAYGEAELPVDVLSVNNRGVLYAFTNFGNLVKIDVSMLPEKKWKEKGATIGSLNPEVAVGEKVAKLMFFDSEPLGELLLFSKNGMVKRTDIAEFASSRSFVNAMVVADGDELINAEIVEDNKNILEITADGLSLVYKADEVPLQGKKSAGVKGVKLNSGDNIAFGGQIEDEGEIAVISSTGYAKRVISSTLEISSRYLKGVKIIDLEKSKVKFVSPVKMPYDIAVVAADNTSILNTEDIRIDTRTTKGKQIFKQKISFVTKI
ncbi:MAG: DNA gyrase subunit A, partial [Clostridia bacterium]